MSDIVAKVQEAADRLGPEITPDRRNPIVVRLKAELLENERKRAIVAEDVPKGSAFSILSDEGTGIGGGDSAPTPLSYFGAAVAF